VASRGEAAQAASSPRGQFTGGIGYGVDGNIVGARAGVRIAF
jgi:hypothetical protein